MRIDDISPSVGALEIKFSAGIQGPSGKSQCVALSADGERAYIGGHSGVWRSDDGGVSWRHPEWLPGTVGGPTRPGALIPPNVYDLVVHPGVPDVVFAAAAQDMRTVPYDGVWRSTDGALTWSLVHRFVAPSGAISFVGCLSMAPDDANTLYAAGTYAVARSVDGGTIWTETVPPGVSEVGAQGGPVQVTHVAAASAAGRRVYAMGSQFWYSIDGGDTWLTDPGGPSTGAPGPHNSSSSRAMAVHPLDDRVVYVMLTNRVLLKGVFPDPSGPAVWTSLAVPPQRNGGRTASGTAFVVPVATEDGDVFLYVSDMLSVNVCLADPVDADSYGFVDQFMHVDPHGFVATPDFTPWAPDFDPPSFGRALMINDGGAVISTDGTQSWFQATDLSTLNAANVAINSIPDIPVCLTYGGGDDNGFASRDDGASWITQDYEGGDNDCAFADPHQPTRMIVFAPRDGSPEGSLFLYRSSTSEPPNTAFGTHDRITIRAPFFTDPNGSTPNGTMSRAWNVVSSFCNFGYRPLVLTRAGETPRPDSDFITIRWSGEPGASAAFLMRTTALSTVLPGDWASTTDTAEGPGVRVFQVGPGLPDDAAGVVQASGGHDQPTYYLGNTNAVNDDAVPPVSGFVWRLRPGETAWTQIVPAPAGPATVYRYFADPYRPNRIWVLADDAVYRSSDFGATWSTDPGLDAAITENGAFARVNLTASPNPAESVLRDMQFDPVDPDYRLALGIAGVFLTQDGTHWSPLLRSTAMALQPTSMIYDPVGGVRSLYVGTMGRGIVRLRPLPPDWDFPFGSVQEATGHLTLLRVHDLGTGYGPPYDFLDAEVIIWLDSEPMKAFGLKLRVGADGPPERGRLDLLRDSFNRNRPVRIDFIRTGFRSGTIIRVMDTF